MAIHHHTEKEKKAIVRKRKKTIKSRKKTK